MAWISLLKTRRPSLFWRTFLLLCGLVFFSVIGWLQSFRVLSELPYSQGVAQHIVSTVNLTKYALVTADPLYRIDLLKTLAAREGVLISPRDPTDRIAKIPGEGFNGLIEQLVKTSLGPDTVLATRVNGNDGLWVTFDIDGDAYWLQTRGDMLDPPYGTAWLWWALAAGLASLFGATLLARHVAQPLDRLSASARDVSEGRTPPPLPEDASTAEIQAVNVSFNRMVQDLAHMEADRELLLAGVSHDLRTPITRLRLEVELADLPADSRQAMVSDLEQMENIVNQFLAYARRTNEDQVMVNFGEAVGAAINDTRIESDPTVELTTADLPTDITKDAAQNVAILSVADHGKGLPSDQRARVMRPFERGESARSGVTGSGLGLAIVDRIVRRSGGSVELADSYPHGLLVRVRFPVIASSDLRKALKEQDKAAKKIAAEEAKEAKQAAKRGASGSEAGSEAGAVESASDASGANP